MLDSTKQNVVNSLLTLLDEKPMDDITISELTQMAGISRMTFYRNYSCKEDILSEHFKDVLKQYKPSAGLFMGFRSLTEIFICKGIGGYYAGFDETECCKFIAYAIRRETDG